MELDLTKKSGTRRITDLAVSWSWSGDKSTPVRQLTLEMIFDETAGLPIPEIGDIITFLDDAGTRLFVGIVLRRTAGSEQKTISLTCYDYGIYCKRNDGTYKFVRTTPEAITRRVCAGRGIPVAGLPSTGVLLDRKFSGVALDRIISTAWALASESSGKQYAIRYTPSGLLVKERGASAESLVLKAAGNLMEAVTTEDATQLVNSVAIYDANGNFLRRTGDDTTQKLLGVMERHITQRENTDATAEAKKLLVDGAVQRNVTVNVLGDTALLTGETVVVRESATGLQGVFWIDADVHTWKRGNYYCSLTLNCRNVVSTTLAGGEIT